MMRRRSDLPPTPPQPWSEMIPADSFYARLAKWRDVLVDDEDYAPLYKDSPKGKGRPPKRKDKESERPASGEQDSSPANNEPRLRQGVAKDRVLSVVDPEMRVGHKSKRQAWAGYKVHLVEEPESELITEVRARPANEYDADAAPDVVGRQEEFVGLRPKELLCDGAYGSAAVRAEL